MRCSTTLGPLFKFTLLFLFQPLCALSPGKVTGEVHLMILQVALPTESVGGGCRGSGKLSKRENHKLPHSELPGTPPSCLSDRTTVTSSFENPQTGPHQPYFLTCFYGTQRKLLPGKSICNTASWNMSYLVILFCGLNVIHSSFCPSAQAEHLYDTWILA